MADDNYFDDIPDADFIAAASIAEASARPAAPRAAAQTPAARPIPKAATTSTNTPKPVVQPKPQVLPKKSTGSAIIVHPNQKANKTLKFLLGYEFGPPTQAADYILSPTICALFLTLKYHRLHPEYIFQRVKNVGQSYKLRILLILIDTDSPEAHIADLSRLCFMAEWTMICAASPSACARYLEDFKKLDGMQPKSIMGKEKKGYDEQAKEFVGTVKKVTKENTQALLAEMGSIRAAVEADEERLMAIPGWGGVRAKRWVEAVTEPFRPGQAMGKRLQPGVDEEAEAALAEVERAEQQNKRPREDINTGQDTSGILAAVARMREQES